MNPIHLDRLAIGFPMDLVALRTWEVAREMGVSIGTVQRCKRQGYKYRFGRQTTLRHLRAWLAKNPELPPDPHLFHQRARRQVMLARESGRLVSGPCEVCGDTYSLAHHEDYNEPLAVRYLCYTHHVRYHVQLKSGKVTSLDQYVAEQKSLLTSITEAAK
jgi:hypothetical protein